MESASRRLNVIHKHLGKDVFHMSASPSLQVATPSYQYTHNGKQFTSEERDFYEKNGYIVVRQLLSSESLNKYKKRFQDICQGVVSVPGITVMKDVSIVKSEFVQGEKAVNKIQNFQYDDVLFEYCCTPEILDCVESIVGPNIMAMHTMLINKPPDSGSLTSRHPMHQDLHYFPFRPADGIVCAWTAMEPVHRYNGCLQVVPGSHHQGPGRLLEHGYPQWAGGVNKMYHGIVNYDLESCERLHLEMNTGDTVLFHPLLIHGSGANTTQGFRKAISCHYASSDCTYIDVKGTSQEGLAKEVLDIAQKKLGSGVEVEYENIWKLRGRLARGQEINL